MFSNMTMERGVGTCGLLFLFVAQFCQIFANTEVGFHLLLTKMDILDQKIAILEDRDRRLQKTILEQKIAIDTQYIALSKLNAIIRRQSRKMSKCDKCNPDVDKGVSIQQDDTGKRVVENVIDNKPNPLPLQFEKTNTKCAPEKSQPSDVIPSAFLATASVSVQDIEVNQTLLFDSVLLNIGEGYENETGMFTIPEAGIYTFTCSIVNNWQGEQEIHAEIVHNEYGVAKIYVQSDVNLHDQGSQTVTIRAEENDIVYVRNIDYNHITVFGDHYSTFSGYMLWPL